ncbi:hypothetical protein U9M48_018951 [Paspalum notatum var. saurae]|uniref:Uncharacterized protein n=1 Tax=Paspalum notatum var. saurae TaxID=547442 RepID=A0AAQ3TAH1_PASNO
MILCSLKICGASHFTFRRPSPPRVSPPPAPGPRAAFSPPPAAGPARPPRLPASPAVRLFHALSLAPPPLPRGSGGRTPRRLASLLAGGGEAAMRRVAFRPAAPPPLDSAPPRRRPAPPLRAWLPSLPVEE